MHLGHLKIGWQERTEADLKNGRHRRDQDGLRKRHFKWNSKERTREKCLKKKQTHWKRTSKDDIKRKEGTDMRIRKCEREKEIDKKLRRKEIDGKSERENSNGIERERK